MYVKRNFYERDFYAAGLASSPAGASLVSLDSASPAAAAASPAGSASEEVQRV